MKRSIGKSIVVLLIALSVFLTGCSQEQVLDTSLRSAINLVINTAVAENEDAARVVEHMQAKISFEMLSTKTTKKGVDALYRVSSPDLTAFIEDFDANDYATQEEMVEAIIHAIDSAPVTEKEVTVGFQNGVPVEYEDFLYAYSGGSYSLIAGMQGGHNGGDDKDDYNGFDDDDKETNGSKGLAYALNADGKSYCVTGIGTCKDTELKIPDRYKGKPVTKIGQDAFRDNAKIKSIIIPDSVQEIEAFAFFKCSGIETIVIPEGVTYIGQGTFRGCKSLKTVTIPVTVNTIIQKAFRDCTGLADIYFGGTVGQWEAMTKEKSWEMDTYAFAIHCSDGDVMHEDDLITDFVVPDNRIVIKYVAEGKYVTGVPYNYITADGKLRVEMVLTENKTEALAYTIIKNDDGTFSFKTDDGHFLFCDATDVKLVSDKSEYTKFIFRFAENGYYIQSATAQYSGSPQFLEIWGRGKYLTCYSKDTSREDTYIFAFDFEDAAGAAGTVVES